MGHRSVTRSNLTRGRTIVSRDGLGLVTGFGVHVFCRDLFDCLQRSLEDTRGSGGFFLSLIACSVR